MGNKMAGNFPAVFFYHLIELQPCTGFPAFSEKAEKYGKLYASTFSTGTMLK